MIFPFAIIGLFIVVYMVVQLILGQTFSQIAMQLSDLWHLYKPYLRGLTVTVGVPILSMTVWKNRKLMKRLLSKQATSEGKNQAHEK